VEEYSGLICNENWQAEWACSDYRKKFEDATKPSQVQRTEIFHPCLVVRVFGTIGTQALDMADEYSPSKVQ